MRATEHIDAARIVDASANRAREALRVIEDYCRFALDDRILTAETKQIRHDFTETMAEFSLGHLLQARETNRDVGKTICTTQESSRHSLAHVVQANLKRLQESLRSLEEFGKLRSPLLGSSLEKLRYRSYTLERAILLGTNSRDRMENAHLYVLVTGSRCKSGLEWTIKEAASGGAEIFQLREKALKDAELLERARKVRRWTRQAGVLFIMNDRPDIARLAEADGVHVGQGELAVKDVRRIIGPDGLIGVSTHDMDQVRQAVLDGANYVGIGPTFPSATKQFTDFPGLEFIAIASKETSLPAFAIGGINLENLLEVVASGAKRVAVSEAICQAEEPSLVAAAMRRQLKVVAGLP